MKKSFFGYKKSDVETTLNSLREENEQLNSTIATLNAQLKNGDGNSAKVTLLESTIEQTKQDLKNSQATIATLEHDKAELQNKLSTLESETAELQDKLKSIEELHSSLEQQFEDVKKERDALELKLKHSHTCVDSEYSQRVAATAILSDEKIGAFDDNYEDSLEESFEDVSESSEIEEIKSLELNKPIILDNSSYLLIIENLKKDLASEKAKKDALYLTLTSQVQELTAVTLELSSIKDRNAELEDAKETISIQQNEISHLHEEITGYEEELQLLNQKISSLEISLQEYNKLKKLEGKFESQHALASDISLAAYNEMSNLQNVVAESIQSLINEYHKHIIHNNEVIRKEIEQYQKDYRNMLHNFINKASEFPIALTTLESKYSNVSKFNMDVDSIYQQMNQTITKFMDETTVLLNKE